MTDSKNNKDKPEETNAEQPVEQESADNVTELPLGNKASSEEQDIEEQSEPDLETQLKELNAKYLRSLADADNLRRRMDKERSDILKFGNEKIIQDVLPVMDSFEKAFAESAEQKDEALKSFFDGFKLVFEQLKSALEKNGLKRVSSKDQLFDPNVHQAIQKTDDDSVTEDTVHEEFAAGYTLNGRLVRPAMVSVKSPSSKG